MRGDSTNQGELFSYVSLEDRIPDNHPIRKVRKIVDAALAEIESAFDEMYSSAEVTEAGARQEWDAGTTMLAAQGTRPGMTVGADRGYDTGEIERSSVRSHSPAGHLPGSREN